MAQTIEPTEKLLLEIALLEKKIKAAPQHPDVLLWKQARKEKITQYQSLKIH